MAVPQAQLGSVAVPQAQLGGVLSQCPPAPELLAAQHPDVPAALAQFLCGGAVILQLPIPECDLQRERDLNPSLPTTGQGVLPGTHLVGLGEEVHGVGSLEEVHEGEAVVQGGVTLSVAFSLGRKGAVVARAGDRQADTTSPESWMGSPNMCLAAVAT